MNGFKGALAIVSITSLVACGGGASTPSTSSRSAGPASTGVASATVQITVPAPAQAATSSAQRNPAFVSPSTKSISIVIGGNTFNEDLSPAAAGCTASTPAGSFSCALTVTAPIGTTSLTAKTYSAITEGGSLLSNTALTFAALQEGSANVVPLVLNAVPASVSVASLPPPNEQYYVTNGGSATLYGTDSVQVAVQAFDATGNMIIGPGSPTYTLVASNPAVLSVAAVTNTNNVFALTPTPGNDTTLNATATPIIGSPVTTAIPIALRHIVIAASSSPALPPYHVYLYNDRGTSAVTTITSGANTPVGVAIDRNQTVYVANDFGSDVTVYPNGTTAPQQTLTDGIVAPNAVAVDPAGTLYVSDFSYDYVQSFLAESNTSSTFASGFSAPSGIAVSHAGEIAVVDNGSNTVYLYPPGTNVSSYSISLSNASGVAFDRAGNLWVAAQNGVYEYAPGATTSFFSITSGISRALTVAVDIAGYVYIDDYTLGKIFVFAPGTNSSPVETITGLINSQGIAVFPN